MLEAYTLKQVQTCLSLLKQFQNNGIKTIHEIEIILENKITGKLPETYLKKVRTKEICPSCKKGSFDKIYNDEGLNLFGCKKCRYSEIRE
jgi:hypothetical protein